MITLNEFARLMPKVELHVHLEGSIRPATLLELAARNHVKLPAADEEGLKEFYRFRDFEHFVDVYFTVTRCLRTPEDYALIAYQFGCDCAQQNIRYAEVTFTMTTNMQFSGLPWQAILEGLNEGRSRARAEHGVDWGWVFDINRNQPETQQALVEIALAARSSGVVALGLGGSETVSPAGLFQESFERARQAGLRRVPHAGETQGPESIWTALSRLYADRIGHGVRAVEDPALVEFLRVNRIPLEVCPTSNLCLGIYPNPASHPLNRLCEAGVFVTVNSDDPPMFGTSLNGEYELLVNEFGFNRSELEQINLNALHASFLSQEEKSRLEIDFKGEFARLGSLE